MNRIIAKSAIGLFSVLLTTSVALAQGPAVSDPTTADCANSAYELTSGTATVTGQTLTANTTTGVNNCAIYVKNTGTSLTVTNSTLNSLQTAFNGAGVEAAYGGKATITNSPINVDWVNGIYATSYGTDCYTTAGVEQPAYLPCSSVTYNNSTIIATEENAHGVDAMYMGTINLNNVVITTNGDHAAGAVVNDTGDGIINATNVTATTTGSGSSGLYEIGSKSVFTIKNSKFTATASDGAADVVGGVMYLINSTISGYKEGLKVDGTVTINGGSIIGTGTGSVTEASFNNNNPATDTTDVFTYAAGNAINIMPFGAPVVFPATLLIENGAKLIPSAGTADAPTYLIFETSEQTNCAANNTCLTGVVNLLKETLTGNIYRALDGGSTLDINLFYSTLKGTITNSSVALDAHSKWTVTGDSVLDKLTVSACTTSVTASCISKYVTGTGTITYVSADNEWLDNGVYSLGSATLQPAAE